MSKASANDVKKLGFSHLMFNAISEIVDFDLYLQEILDENAGEVKAKLTVAVYDSADPDIQLDVKRTEKYLAAAELWERRANIVQSMALPEDPESTIPAGQSEQARADAYKTRAQEVIDRLNPPAP
ncbi:MAG: hypothetical protein OEV42_05180 [Deltaproteobacteria bacterium]|nr:hypothetical protein [Deltaproteobacteria bacterium]